MASVDDRWMQAAALSAADVRAPALFAAPPRPGSPIIALVARPDARRSSSRWPRWWRAATAARARALLDRVRPAGAPDAKRRRDGPGGAPPRCAASRPACGDGPIGASGSPPSRTAARALRRRSGRRCARAAIDLLRRRCPPIGPRVAAAIAKAASIGGARRRRSRTPRRCDRARWRSTVRRPASRCSSACSSPVEPEPVQVAAVQALGRVPRGAPTPGIGTDPARTLERDDAGRAQRRGRGADRGSRAAWICSSTRCAAAPSRPGPSTSGRSGTW